MTHGEKLAAVALAGVAAYGVVALAQNVTVGDLSTCDTCGAKHSGYGFVAFVTGSDPRVCPKCGQPTLRPASIWDMTKAIVLGR